MVSVDVKRHVKKETLERRKKKTLQKHALLIVVVAVVIVFVIVVCTRKRIKVTDEFYFPVVFVYSNNRFLICCFQDEYLFPEIRTLVCLVAFILKINKGNELAMERRHIYAKTTTRIAYDLARE